MLGSFSMAIEPSLSREDAEYEHDLGRVSLLVFAVMSALGALAGLIVADLLRPSPVDPGALARIGAYSVQVWWLWKVLPRADGSRAVLGGLPAWRSWLTGAATLLSLWFLLAGASWAVALLGEPTTSPKQAVDQSVAALVLAVLLTGLAAPVLEELVFRGVLFRRWRRSLGPTRAALASSLLFALLHPPQQFLGTLLYAMLAVLLYTRTRTLWVPIAVHVANNVMFVCWRWQSSGDANGAASQALTRDVTTWWVPLLLLVPSVAWFTWFVRTSWRTLRSPLPPYERASAVAASEAGAA
jgi:membrane protease YdiL (CAAX protease family)